MSNFTRQKKTLKFSKFLQSERAYAVTSNRDQECIYKVHMGTYVHLQNLTRLSLSFLHRWRTS